MTPSVSVKSVQTSTGRGRAYAHGIAPRRVGVSTRMSQPMNGSAEGAWLLAVPVISGIESTIARIPATPLTIARRRRATNSAS